MLSRFNFQYKNLIVQKWEFQNWHSVLCREVWPGWRTLVAVWSSTWTLRGGSTPGWAWPGQCGESGRSPPSTTTAQSRPRAGSSPQPWREWRMIPFRWGETSLWGDQGTCYVSCRNYIRVILQLPGQNSHHVSPKQNPQR